LRFRRQRLRNLSHPKRSTLSSSTTWLLQPRGCSHECIARVGSIGCISRCNGAWCGGGLTSICSTRIVGRRNKSRVFPRFFFFFFRKRRMTFISICYSAGAYADGLQFHRLFHECNPDIHDAWRNENKINLRLNTRRMARVIPTESFLLFSTRIITGTSCSWRWFKLSLPILDEFIASYFFKYYLYEDERPRINILKKSFLIT